MSTATQQGVQVDVKPIGVESAIVYAPFDEAFESLTGEGYEVISLPQNAKLRIQQGSKSSVSRTSNWTREGVVYIPKEKPRLVRDSPVLASVTQATRAHRRGEEFYLTREQVDSSLGDSVNFPDRYTEIPVNKFGSDALTVYAFGGEAEAKLYGEFLREVGIRKMPVWVVPDDYVKKQDKLFVRQMWFGDLDNGSGLNGYGRYLLIVNRMRGVKMGAEGTSPQGHGNVESYGPAEISKALKELGFSGLENGLVSKLRQ